MHLAGRIGPRLVDIAEQEETSSGEETISGPRVAWAGVWCGQKRTDRPVNKEKLRC